MRAMLTLVIVLGIILVGGAATIAFTIITRATPKHSGDLVLDQPAGTQIVSVAGVGGQLAVALHGGGADRVVLVDLASGHPVGTVTLKK